MKINKIKFLELSDCLQISNGSVELIISTTIGSRILSYSLTDGENILGLHPQVTVSTPLGDWKPYGGHRLWIAPENMPNSYAPDNSPIGFVVDEANNSVHLTQPFEAATKTQKEMIIKLSNADSAIEIEHRITNRAQDEITLAPWALTIMRGGGEAVIPNENFAAYSPATLLPVRSFAVWSYTDFTDPRWTFGKNEIRLRSDEKLGNPQKIGVFNRQGWTAYEWQNLRFTKKFAVDENANYPDLNSNVEIYTAGAFIEVETLAPLQKLLAGETAVHLEHWTLEKL